MTGSASSVLALVGPRASGKTTLARALGVRLGWPVLDGDDLVAARAGQPAGDLLAAAGEPAFRAVEERVSLEALAPGPPRIVALGGGAVLAAPVRARLAARDVYTVWLEARVEDLAARQRLSGLHRPPLTALPLADEIAAVLAQRRRFYEQVARMRVNTSAANVDACVERISCKMRAFLRGPG